MSMSEVPRPLESAGVRLDAWISTLFPSWGERRAGARFRQQQFELLGYRGARPLRTDRKRASTGRADHQLEATLDRRDMVDRARQLERSSVLAEGILSRSVENVVGCGYPLQAQTKNKRWNKRAEELWKEWGDNAADVRHMATWDELLALTFRSYLRDGDVGSILLGDGQIQPFESDQLSSPTGRSLSREMVDGIKLDRRGRPTSFFIVDSPDPINASVRFQKHTEIPAESVLYLPRRTRLGQTRGMSCFTTISWLLDQIDGNIEAVTVASRMAASYGLLMTQPTPTGGVTQRSASGQDLPKVSIEPGMTKYLKPGWEVQQIKPEQPTQNFPEFLRTLGRFVGMALGLPLEIAFGDYSNTSFTSGRMALLSAWRTWKCYQKMLKRYSTQVYFWKLFEWMSVGALPVQQDALKHVWHAPGWQFVDPTKEISAALAAADGGLKSYTQIAAEMGNDWLQLVEARKQEMEELESAGLSLPARSNLTRDPLQPAAPIDEEPDPDESKEDEKDGEPEGNESTNLDRTKTEIDTFSIGVRAGVITPNIEDENHFRSAIGVPELTQDVQDVWEEEPTRRPVTLSAPKDNPGAAPIDEEPDPDEGDPAQGDDDKDEDADDKDEDADDKDED